MLYLRICFDKEGAATFETNCARLTASISGRTSRTSEWRKVVQGGPMSATDDASRNVGSFLVVDAASIDVAKRFHDADPFTKAGLFGRADVVCWDRHIGNDNQTEYVP